MSVYTKPHHRPDGSIIVSRAWNAFLRQRELNMIVRSPVNDVIAEIFGSLGDTDRDILQRFYQSDHQIPVRFARETGIQVQTLLPILRRNQAEVFRRLGFPQE